LVLLDDVFLGVIFWAKGEECFAFGGVAERVGDGELEWGGESEGVEGGLGGLGVGLGAGEVEGFVEAAPWVVASD
jgi:hypothetical protein